jgi:TolB-like protein/class 3 adenylate cyclase
VGEEQTRRRLAAILAADVAGYSRLMADDEHATVAALDGGRRVFKTWIEAHRGRVIDMAGDSVLALFETVTGAVEAAAAIQTELAEAERGVPAHRLMRFRIGIHLDDIIEKDDGTIYGDGVNIAARIQSIAIPGGLSISNTVRGAVRGKLADAFDDDGQHSLKNIAEPVHVFRWRGGPEALPESAGAQPAAAAASNRPSIAVLPFANMSGDPEQGFFADGIAEDIITALARFKELFVIARNSSFLFKDRAVDVQEIARSLGVRYVLEGSVRKAGSRVRIGGRLVETTARTQLWAETFDGALDDVFDLQDRITARVVGAISPSIRRAEIERVRRKPPADLVAYDYFLRAAPLIEVNAPSAIEAGIPLLRQALDLDPHYALAHAYLAHGHSQRWQRFGRAPEDRMAAENHARTVLAEDGDDGNALATAAFALCNVEGDTGLAGAAFTRSAALNPNSFRVLSLSAIFHARGGHAGTALDQAHAALRLNPLDPLGFEPKIALTIAHFSRGEFADSAVWARRSAESNPQFPVARFWLVASLGAIGDVDGARLALERMQADFPGVAHRRLADFAYFDPELRQRATAAFVAIEEAR